MTDDTWLTDHLLGEDDPAQRDETARRIAGDPELTRRATELRGVIAHLRDLPTEAWGAVTDGPARAPVEPSAPPATGGDTRGPQRPARRRRRALVAGLAGTVLFVAGGAVGALVRSDGHAHGGSAGRSLALRPFSSDPRARGDARLTRNGRLRLTVSGLPRIRRGEYYEAWLMTSQTRLVPLAAFRTNDGSASLSLIPPTALSDYSYIDISLQSRANGLAHSADSVLRGSTRGAS